MSTDSKTLDFARGCNSIQNQLVNFSYFSSFGTVRSEVRILSPDQSKSKQPNYFRAAIIGGLISFTVSRLSAEDFDNEDAVGSHDCGPRLEP